MKIWKAIKILEEMMNNTDYDDEFEALTMGAEALSIIDELRGMIERDIK